MYILNFCRFPLFLVFFLVFFSFKLGRCSSSLPPFGAIVRANCASRIFFSCCVLNGSQVLGFDLDTRFLSLSWVPILGALLGVRSSFPSYPTRLASPFCSQAHHFLFLVATPSFSVLFSPGFYFSVLRFLSLFFSRCLFAIWSRSSLSCRFIPGSPLVPVIFSFIDIPLTFLSAGFFLDPNSTVPTL